MTFHISFRILGIPKYFGSSDGRILLDAEPIAFPGTGRTCDKRLIWIQRMEWILLILFVIVAIISGIQVYLTKRQEVEA